MHAKGTAVKSLQDFVQKHFESRYNEWISHLPAPSRNIFSAPILVTDWYPIIESLIEPIKTIANLFYEGDTVKAGWETGRYSAETALNGIYKIFVRISTPKYIIERATKIIPVYYSPSELVVKDSGPKHLIITITVLPIRDQILESRIAGWVQKAMEVTGCKNVKVDIQLSQARNDSVTEMYINWD
jgi:hypothetical protein